MSAGSHWDGTESNPCKLPISKVDCGFGVCVEVYQLVLVLNSKLVSNTSITVSSHHFPPTGNNRQTNEFSKTVDCSAVSRRTNTPDPLRPYVDGHFWSHDVDRRSSFKPTMIVNEYLHIHSRALTIRAQISKVPTAFPNICDLKWNNDSADQFPHTYFDQNLKLFFNGYHTTETP